MKLGFRLLLWVLVVGSIGVALSETRSAYLAKAAREESSAKIVRSMGLAPQPPKHLAAQFSDNQGRMLADPPSDSRSLIDPPTIVLAHLVSEDAENPGIDWAAFAEHLGKAIGRPVVHQPFENNPDDLDQIKEGKITLVALHAAETPFLVNSFGFQPAAVLGDDSGATGNHLDIIVPPDSPLTSLAALRGKSLVCTVPSSVTGYRAAVAILLHTQSLRPNVDYTLTWSTGQKKSISGVVKKNFEAAAVSDDKLQGLLKKGKLSESDYKILYASEVIPRTTIGYFFNLKPELAAKLRAAILAYRPMAASEASAQTGDTEAPEASAKHMHFIPVDYKKDFQLVREIDDSFDPRMGVKPPKHHHTPADPATQP